MLVIDEREALKEKLLVRTAFESRVRAFDFVCFFSVLPKEIPLLFGVFM